MTLVLLVVLLLGQLLLLLQVLMVLQKSLGVGWSEVVQRGRVQQWMRVVS